MVTSVGISDAPAKIVLLYAHCRNQLPLAAESKGFYQTRLPLEGRHHVLQVLL